MKVAIDKKCIGNLKKGHEYIYLFNDETLKELLETNLHCVYYKNCDFVDINLTDYDIDCYKKESIKNKNWDVIPKKVEYKIGIIIPNYNYEHTLNKCIDSILEQTYQNFEIIYIDDMSTDSSIEIMEQYQKQYKEKIKIVKLKQKRYNGGARNEGYLYLSDDVDYVWYVDSDDWLYNKYSLQEINDKLQKKPDVLFVGMAEYKDGETRTIVTPDYKDKYEAIAGWSGSSGKVIKRQLAVRQECLYNEGTLKEDRNQHCKICIYMNTFDILKKPVYVWNRTNYKSVTTLRDKVLWKTSTIRHYADTMQLALSVKGQDYKIDSYLNERLLMTKMEMDGGGDKQW